MVTNSEEFLFFLFSLPFLFLFFDDTFTSVKSDFLRALFCPIKFQLGTFSVCLLNRGKIGCGVFLCCNSINCLLLMYRPSREEIWSSEKTHINKVDQLLYLRINSSTLISFVFLLVGKMVLGIEQKVSQFLLQRENLFKKLSVR